MLNVRNFVRRAHPGQEVAVVIISVLSGKDALAAGSAVDADDFLTKPLTFVEIASRINMMLKMTELVRSNAAKVGAYLDTLPPPVFERIKRGHGVAERVESVSVVVARIVGIDAFAERAAPTALAQALSAVSEVFEALARKHGAFRIESTGALLAAGANSFCSVLAVPRALSPRCF